MSGKPIIDELIEKIESKIGERAFIVLLLMLIFGCLGVMQWKMPLSTMAWLGIILTSAIYAALIGYLGWKIKKQKKDKQSGH